MIRDSLDQVLSSFIGELHLTPLHAIIQMRPSFAYMDRADQKIKTDVGPAGDGGQSIQRYYSRFIERRKLLSEICA